MGFFCYEIAAQHCAEGGNIKKAVSRVGEVIFNFNDISVYGYAVSLYGLRNFNGQRAVFSKLVFPDFDFIIF